MKGEAQTSASVYSKAAAIFLGFWAVLHVGAAVSTWMTAAAVDDLLAAGRIRQNAWHLFGMAIFVGVLTPSIWRNAVSSAVNATVITTFTDIGFIVLLLLPGVVPIIPGIFGPSVWAIALILIILAHNKGLKIFGIQDTSK
ncbi:MAG: hypothetical protein AAFQ58_21400 [Pseudomonadota bacterium]